VQSHEQPGRPWLWAGALAAVVAVCVLSGGIVPAVMLLVPGLVFLLGMMRA
jgi:hypothetical protein